MPGAKQGLDSLHTEESGTAHNEDSHNAPSDDDNRSLSRQGAGNGCGPIRAAPLR